MSLLAIGSDKIPHIDVEPTPASIAVKIALFVITGVGIILTIGHATLFTHTWTLVLSAGASLVLIGGAYLFYYAKVVTYDWKFKLLFALGVIALVGVGVAASPDRLTTATITAFPCAALLAVEIVSDFALKYLLKRFHEREKGEGVEYVPPKPKAAPAPTTPMTFTYHAWSYRGHKVMVPAGEAPEFLFVSKRLPTTQDITLNYLPTPRVQNTETSLIFYQMEVYGKKTWFHSENPLAIPPPAEVHPFTDYVHSTEDVIPALQS